VDKSQAAGNPPDIVPSKNAWLRKDGMAIALLAGLTILLLWPYLLASPTPLIYPNSSLGGDLPREFWPASYFIKQSILSSGVLPLWRPYLLSGAPLVGHPIFPIFYPPHWIVLVLPLALAINLDLALHLFWMALGVYLLLRWETSASHEAAFLGALVFSQSPMWIAHAGGGHIAMLAAIAWFPWVWLAASRFWKTSQVRWAIFGGVGLAAQFMNHGYFFALTLLAVAAVSAVLFVARRGKGFGRLCLGWSAALAAAFVLSAVQLLPFLELFFHSNRAAMSLEEASFGSLPLPLLLGMFLPPTLKFPEFFLYPGIGVVALAVVSRTGGWSKREWAIVLAVFLGLILALGTNTPIYKLMFTIVPGYSTLRVPARWWIFSLFGLALLAAWGMDKWRAGSPAPKFKLSNPLLILGVVYVSTIFIWAVLDGAFPFAVMPHAVIMLLLLLLISRNANRVTLFLVLVLVAADLLWTASELIRPFPESEIAATNPVVTLLQTAAKNGERSFAPYGGLEVSQLAKYDLRAADGYDSFVLDAYAKLGQYASGCEDSRYAVSVPSTASNPDAVKACPEFTPRLPLLALLNVRYVILPHPAQLPGADPVLSDNGLWVYRLPPGDGSAFGVTQEIVAAPAQCLAALGRADPSRQVVLEEQFPLASAGTPPAVLSEQEETNQATFVVDAANSGMLVRSESWAPGWKAFVDGKPARVLRADCALQAVWLDAGVHTVVFIYEPESYLAGRWISLGGVILLLLGLIGSAVIRRFLRNRVSTPLPKS
jgi:hypothetical protein